MTTTTNRLLERLRPRFTPAAPWIAVGVSLVLRAVYYYQVRGNPYFEHLVLDEWYHDKWAREIVSGHAAVRIPFFRAPLYPYVLSLFYLLPGGPNFDLIRGFQLLLGAATPAVVWAIARRLRPDLPRLATAAALVAALDGMLIYFEADLLIESLLALLSSVFVLLILRAGETGQKRRWFAAGVVLGLFAIARPNVLAFSPLLFAIALGWRSGEFSLRRPRWAAGLVLAAGAWLIVLPVTVTNWVVGGDRVLVSYQGGINFYVGNNPTADGWSATAPGWGGGYDDAVEDAEAAEGRRLTPTEAARHWYRKAFAWWREHPGDAVTLTVKKANFLLSGVEFPNNRITDVFFEEFAPLWTPFLYLLFLMIPLGLVGAVSLWRRRQMGGRVILLYMLVYALTIVPFFVADRYRVPLRPLLAILAVEGAWLGIQGLRARGLRGVGPAAAAIAIGLVVNLNPWMRELLPAGNASGLTLYNHAAEFYAERGDYDKAIDYQRLTVEHLRRYPKVHIELGKLYRAAGNLPGAIASFEQARRLDPAELESLTALVEALEASGRHPEAEHVCLDAAEARSITRGDAWSMIGELRWRAGRADQAVSAWQRALEFEPHHESARANLERARRETPAKPRSPR